MDKQEAKSSFPSHNHLLRHFLEQGNHLHSNSEIFLWVFRAFGTKQPERTHKEKHELHRCTHASSDEEEENRTACEGGSCQQPRNPEAAGTPWCDMKGRRPPAPDPLLQKPDKSHAASRPSSSPSPQIAQGTLDKMAASPRGPNPTRRGEAGANGRRPSLPQPARRARHAGCSLEEATGPLSSTGDTH